MDAYTLPPSTMDPYALPITAEPVQLYQTLIAMKSKVCAGMKTPTIKCPIGAKGQFDPVFCQHHKHHMGGPMRIGWAYIFAQEAELPTILRLRGWTGEAIGGLVKRLRIVEKEEREEQDLAARMQQQANVRDRTESDQSFAAIAHHCDRAQVDPRDDAHVESRGAFWSDSDGSDLATPKQHPALTYGYNSEEEKPRPATTYDDSSDEL